MIRNKFNNSINRIILSIILGIAIGFFVCFISIRFGFEYIKNSSLNEYNVNIIGFNIFNIRRIGNEFKGIPNNNNMSFIGIIFSMVLAITVEVFMNFKSKKSKRKK